MIKRKTNILIIVIIHAFAGCNVKDELKDGLTNPDFNMKNNLQWNEDTIHLKNNTELDQNVSKELSKDDDTIYNDVQIELIFSNRFHGIQLMNNDELYLLMDSLEFYSNKTDGAGTESLANFIFEIFMIHPEQISSYFCIKKNFASEYLLIDQICQNIGLRTDMMSIQDFELLLFRIIGDKNGEVGHRIMNALKKMNC